jgi:hypothetical protein
MNAATRASHFVVAVIPRLEAAGAAAFIAVTCFAHPSMARLASMHSGAAPAVAASGPTPGLSLFGPPWT